MRSSAFGDSGTIDSASSDSRPGAYTYNDAGSTRIDHEGRVFAVPKHFPAVNGLRTEINQFAGLGITDVTNWTQTNAAIAYAGGGEYLITGLDGGTGDFVIAPTILSGTSVVGLDEGCCMWIKATSGSDVGTDAVITLDRASGGSSVASAVTITLTADYQPVGVPAVTGVTSNTGWTVKISGAASSSATNCTIKDPTGVDLTSRGNAVLPLPIPLGAELVSNGTFDTDTTGWTGYNNATLSVDAGRLSIVGAADTARATSPVALKMGVRYALSCDFEKVTGESIILGISPNANGSSATFVSSTDTSGTLGFAFTASATTMYVSLSRLSSTSSELFYDNVSLKEAALGIQQFSDTNGNTVSSGIITAAAGDDLHPVLFEQVKSGASRTRAHQKNAQFTPWSASDSVVANERRFPTDWMTNYNRQFCFYADGSGTTGGSEPDWSTATDSGDTVSDNGITWTAVYATNRGLTIEPATTQDISDAGVAASGGSASTYPTDWAEVGYTDRVAVVGYGVSPVNSDYKYVDLQFSNSSTTAYPAVRFYDTSTTGVSQGDKVTVSVWVQLIAGSIAGTPKLSVAERNSGDSFLSRSSGAITITDEMKRLDATITLAEAAVDRYRPEIWIDGLPNGADFTIRITLPNACQQDHVSSFIGAQATRTTKEAAMTYPLANYNDAATTCFVDVSIGVDQADLAANQGLVSFSTSSVALGPYLTSAGNLSISDGTNSASRNDWGESPNNVMRIAAGVSTPDSEMYVARTTEEQAYSIGTGTFDGAIGTDTNIVLAHTISYPITFHGIRIIPGIYVSDPEDYIAFDDLRYV